MVEIFKTNVKSKELAEKVLKTLHARLPTYFFNFDLDDCDRILRAQSTTHLIEIKRIIEIVKDHGIEINLFEE